MVLFHNTDLNNLNSIVEKGLLSSNECGVNNWDEGKRAKNSADVVYLFEPIGRQNSFSNLGIALIEAEVDPEAISESELAINDFGRGKYNEYTVEKVAPERIKAIYIPKVFKNRISGLSEKVLEKVVWCEMNAKVFDHCEETGEIGDFGIPKTRSIFRDATSDELELFGRTAEMSVCGFNFFRGMNDDRTMLDLDEIVYVR